MKLKYQTQRVSAGEYQVVDTTTNKEHALCCEFEGEAMSARDRAVDITLALLTRDTLAEVMPDVGCDDATELLNWLDYNRESIRDADDKCIAAKFIDYISRTQSAKARLAQVSK
jgi:hypothetical protein